LSAWGLYYRDEVGNISTSRAYRDEYGKKVVFALAPRYGLLGGWKANWEIGYNLNSKGYLYNEGNKFQLDNINLEYTLEKVLTENYSFKIILPEGATGIKVKIGNV
jgi:oligosaccharyltransferase complex subunit alpha (ribophorin I)